MSQDLADMTYAELASKMWAVKASLKGLFVDLRTCKTPVHLQLKVDMKRFKAQREVLQRRIVEKISKLSSELERIEKTLAME